MSVIDRICYECLASVSLLQVVDRSRTSPGLKLRQGLPVICSPPDKIVVSYIDTPVLQISLQWISLPETAILQCGVHPLKDRLRQRRQPSPTTRSQPTASWPKLADCGPISSLGGAFPHTNYAFPLFSNVPRSRFRRGLGLKNLYKLQYYCMTNKPASDLQGCVQLSSSIQS